MRRVLNKLDRLAEGGQVLEATQVYEAHLNRIAEVPTINQRLLKNTMLKAYANAGEYEKALALFKALREPTTIKQVGKLMEAANKAGLPLAGEEWFAFCLKHKLPVSNIHYHMVVQVYCKTKQTKQAGLWVHRRLGTGINPDLHTYNLMLQGYAQVKDLKSARDWFAKLKEAELEPDVYSYRAMIFAQAGAHNFEEAQTLYHQIPSKEWQADLTILAGLLRAAANAGHMEGSQHWFQMLVNLGGPPSTLNWNALLQPYAKHGKVDRVLQLYAQIGSPDVHSLNLGLTAFRNHSQPRWEEAHQFYRQHSPWAPNETTFNVLLSLLLREPAGSPTEGDREICQETRELNVILKPHTAALLIRGLNRLSQYETALDVYSQYPLNSLCAPIFAAMLDAVRERQDPRLGRQVAHQMQHHLGSKIPLF